MFGCLSFVFSSGMRPSLFLSVCVVFLCLKEADLKGEGNHYMIADLDCLLLLFFFFVN
ncbi:hypothetical protein Hanom_Chr02g00098851 [Helianthus anomalus]